MKKTLASATVRPTRLDKRQLIDVRSNQHQADEAITRPTGHNQRRNIMKTTALKTLTACIIGLSLTGCAAQSPTEGRSTESTTSVSAVETEENLTNSEETSIPAPNATSGWDSPDTITAAEDTLSSFTITTGADYGGLMQIDLNAVEYFPSREHPGKVIGALAFTVTNVGTTPTGLPAPIDGADWVYSTDVNGTGAESFGEMNHGYSESWVGRTVDHWHSEEHAPGESTQMLVTVMLDQKGGYIVYNTDLGPMNEPIALPESDTPGDNALIDEAASISAELGYDMMD